MVKLWISLHSNKGYYLVDDEFPHKVYDIGLCHGGPVSLDDFYDIYIK